METPPVDPRIERVRLLYVGSDVPMREISRRVGVPLTTLQTWIKRHGWPMRGPRPFGQRPAQPPPLPEPDPAPVAPQAAVTGKIRAGATGAAKRKRPTTRTLVDRLYRIINHHIEVMESRMSDDDHTTQGDNPERDARAIGNLVRSVEKLKELEPEHSKRDARSVGTSRYPLSPGEEEKLRDEIIDRLLRLRERLRTPRPD